MAAENEAGVNNAVGSITSDSKAGSPANSSSNNVATNASGQPTKNTFGHIRLDISNSVLPLEKLAGTPSARDGLSEDLEMQLRSFGCELIQLAGKLLRLPQVAMATGCVLFQRFYYAKSLVRIPFDVVAMGCIGLASKIEEAPRRIRDIINVFNHIKQVRNGRTISPVVLDQNYIRLKNDVIKAERRVLKELGFCVHVKHPHKIIVMYLKWLEFDSHRELLQMSWNFMNDSLRTDVFVRYPPETIAVACIYLSARKLREPLPKDPSWFDVLGVEEDDIKDCCYRMICLYNRKKANQDELESSVEALKKKMDSERKAARDMSTINTPNQSSPASRTASPTASSNQPAVPGSNDGHNGDNNDDDGHKERPSPNSHHHHHHHHKSKKKKHKRSRSRSHEERDYRKDRKKSKHSRTRSSSLSPAKKRKHGHKEKMRQRSRSRDRDFHYGRRGGVAAVGVNDEKHYSRDRDRGNGYKGRDHYGSRR